MFQKIATLFLFSFAISTQVEAQRIQDIARVQGIRPQQIKGVGLVTGLSGSGDNPKNALTRKLYRAYLESMGYKVDDRADLKTKNIAVVLVTANVSSWTQRGSQFDVTLSSIGEAKSLKGGYLQETHLYRPLRAGEDKDKRFPIALAQGVLRLEGEAPNVGFAPATLEGDVSFPVHGQDRKQFRVVLNRPDFSSATLIARAINGSPRMKFLAKEEMPLAYADGLGSVVVKVPKRFQGKKRVVDFISKVMTDVAVEGLDPEARVVIDKANKSVAINGRVMVYPCIVTFKGMKITIAYDAGAADPNDKNRNKTLRQPVPLVVVIDELTSGGLSSEDMPAIIRLIVDSNSLIGKLIER